MDTSCWLSVVEFLVFSNMFKVMLCMELGDHHVIASDNTRDNGGSGYETFDTQLNITIYPTQIQEIFMNQQTDIYINYTMTLISNGKMDGRANNGSAKMSDVSYVATIMSQNPYIVLPLGHNYGPPSNFTDDISILLHANKSNMFTVEALCVGRASLIIQVTSFYGHLSGYDINSELSTSSKIATYAHNPYRVTVIRKLRFVDVIFDWVITVIVGLNSFSIGCMTEWSSLRMHLRHPTSILIAACCQFIIMPTVSINTIPV
jgi:hypothetical protein